MRKNVLMNKTEHRNGKDIIETKDTNVIELLKNKISETIIEEKTEYCSCKKLAIVYTNMDDFGYWYVCDTCGKIVEDTYKYFSESDE